MKFLGILAITLILILPSPIVAGDMLDIYKIQGLTLNNVGLITRFPFVHAVAYNLYVVKDGLLKDLLELVIASQSDDEDMGDLIFLETELAQGWPCALNHPEVIDWLRKWLFGY